MTENIETEVLEDGKQKRVLAEMEPRIIPEGTAATLRFI
jgi:hypothetical protein